MTEQTPNEPRDLDLRTAPFPCCIHCPEDDPEYHEENPRDSHETSCSTCDDGMRMRAEKAEAELAALRARPTLDRERVLEVLGNTLTEVFNCCSGYMRPSEGHDVFPPCATWRQRTAISDALLAAVGQDTPEPEWTDPEPWRQAPGGFRHARQENVSGVPRFQYKPRTREQYDAEQ